MCCIILHTCCAPPPFDSVFHVFPPLPTRSLPTSPVWDDRHTHICTYTRPQQNRLHITVRSRPLPLRSSCLVFRPVPVFSPLCVWHVGWLYRSRCPLASVAGVYARSCWCGRLRKPPACTRTGRLMSSNDISRLHVFGCVSPHLLSALCVRVRAYATGTGRHVPAGIMYWVENECRSAWENDQSCLD